MLTFVNHLHKIHLIMIEIIFKRFYNKNSEYICSNLYFLTNIRVILLETCIHRVICARDNSQVKEKWGNSEIGLKWFRRFWVREWYNRTWGSLVFAPESLSKTVLRKKTYLLEETGPRTTGKESFFSNESKFNLD